MLQNSRIRLCAPDFGIYIITVENTLVNNNPS